MMVQSLGVALHPAREDEPGLEDQRNAMMRKFLHRSCRLDIELGADTMSCFLCVLRAAIAESSNVEILLLLAMSHDECGAPSQILNNVS